MLNFIQYVLFIIFSIYVFIKTLAYALYEIKTENNKFGGITIIVFLSIICLGINLFVFLK